MTRTITLKESQGTYSVSLDKAQSIRKPVILKRNGQRVAALIPINDYEQFIVWRRKQRPIQRKPSRLSRPPAVAPARARKAPTPRKRSKGLLGDTSWMIEGKPGHVIQFEEFSTHHGYEQLEGRKGS